MCTVFDGVMVDCCMAPCAGGCMCTPAERVLRAYSDGRYKGRMTPAQRIWCVAEADWAGEGMWREDNLEALNDGDLAATVLDMWRRYCQRHGLL